MAEREQQHAPVAARPTPALARTSEQSAAPEPPSPRRLRRLAWWRAALLIFCAFAVLGAVPAVLSGDVFGMWHLGGFGSIVPPPAPTTTPAPDLALPRQAWIAAETRVL
ncbi:MAG TPA: hypothetical protein VKT52_00510, partial [Ktedonobacterales bacterium]|nr:hypothetical protein [Ktedonobacterales bacterium]